MTIEDQIREEIDRLLKCGATKKSIADKFDLSQTHMGKIISRDRNLDGLALHSIQHAFPDALLTIGNQVLNTGTINGNITQTTDSISSFKSRLLSQLLQLDLDGDSLVNVMKLVNDAK